MRILKTVFAATLLVGATACIEGIEPTRERTAFVSAVAHESTPSNYLIRLTAAFYRLEEGASRLDTPETCVGLPYSILPAPIAYLPTLSAGTHLYTRVAGRTDTLFQVNSAGLLLYQLLSVSGIPFTVGDTLRLTVPGDVTGFPPAQLSVRVAEPFTYDAIGSSLEGEPLPITWTPAAAPGALMIYSLRYNSSGVSIEPDAQIYCVFLDDGAAQVPAGLAISWGVADPASRSVYASRVRRATSEINARTRVNLFSFFDVPTPPLPSP